MEKWQKQLNLWTRHPFIKQLAGKFPKAEIFLVGGAVRDAILGKNTQDFDFVIRNISKASLQKFLATQGKVNLVGKKFGVFKFRPKNWKNKDIDIALPRTEHSINFSGAYRNFKIKSNAKLKIEDDLSRRDFTINAMAWNIKNQQLIDPFSGIKDLKNKIIRTVGQPQKRFAEDYSRILRALRLACQLDFSIEKNTYQQLKKSINNLGKKTTDGWVVAREIIAKELTKMIAKNPIRALKLLAESGAMKILLPDLLKTKNCPQPKNFHSEGDVWQHTLIAIEKLNSPKFKKEFSVGAIKPEIIWGLIFHDIGKPLTMTKTDRLRFNNHDVVSAEKFTKIANQLKLSSAGLDVELTKKIIVKHMLPTAGQIKDMKETTIEKYFFNKDFPGQELLMLIFADISATIPPSGNPDFSSYQALTGRIKKLKGRVKTKKLLPKPLINGYDLIKNFKLKSSPKIGELLAIGREAQLAGKITTKAQGIKYLKKYL